MCYKVYLHELVYSSFIKAIKLSQKMSALLGNSFVNSFNLPVIALALRQ